MVLMHMIKFMLYSLLVETGGVSADFRWVIINIHIIHGLI